MKALVIGATGAVGKNLGRSAPGRCPVLLPGHYHQSCRLTGRPMESGLHLPVRGCFILRPPSLIRKGSDRFGEKVGIVALKAFNAIGLMRSFTPMPTEAVAAAMIRLAKSGRNGVEIIESQEILKVQ